MIPLYDDNPTRSPPIMTIGLIAICVLVFLWQLSLEARGEAAAFEVTVGLGFIPARFFTDAELPLNIRTIPAELTLFSSMFLHGGILHIAGNMLYLWIFGNNIEDAMGWFRFIAFYLACGVAAALAQGLTDPGSTIPMIGASGAISGVLGAYLLLYPRAHVYTLLFFGFFVQIVRLPAVAILGFYLVLQLVNAAMTPPDKPGVAWWAHIGGFAAGILLTPMLKGRDIPLFAPARPPRDQGQQQQRTPVPYRREGPWGRRD
ncbi:MAG: rhomboid family intramembrane serine protease [Alphaproteobacteria bacterium]|nr:rhomboid family intramembrane serine protease [Alphaproteobacteria bacterium]